MQEKTKFFLYIEEIFGYHDIRWNLGLCAEKFVRFHHSTVCFHISGRMHKNVKGKGRKVLEFVGVSKTFKPESS